MAYEIKPFSLDPKSVKGISEKILISHYENNYVGAVKRLNAIAVQLAELDFAKAPNFLINDRPTLADFFMLPTMTSLSLTPEGQQMLSSKPRIAAWRAAMEALPSVIAVRALVMPHVGKPVEHARQWVVNHRPRY